LREFVRRRDAEAALFRNEQAEQRLHDAELFTILAATGAEESGLVAGTVGELPGWWAMAAGS
jgi:hypothetical protein